MFEELEKMSNEERREIILLRMKLRSLATLLRDGIPSHIFDFITIHCLTPEQSRIVRDRVEHNEGVHFLPDTEEAYTELRVALGVENARV